MMGGSPGLSEMQGNRKEGEMGVEAIWGWRIRFGRTKQLGRRLKKWRAENRDLGYSEPMASQPSDAR